MNKLTSLGLTVGGIWLASRLGLLDMVIGGVIGDLSAEAARLSAPIAAFLIAIAGVAALAGLGLTLHRGTRALGVELMIFSALLMVGSHMVPTAGTWVSREGALMAQQMSHAPVVAPMGTGR